MIEYELIIPSASRPHLLEPTLSTILKYVDQMPKKIIISDDAAFRGKRTMLEDALSRAIPACVPFVFKYNDPPIGHGNAVCWMLDQVSTGYIMYAQDDHVAMRPIPIANCLDVMDTYDLHHVRFNKRDTMDAKGDWKKIETTFGSTTLTVSDHWYFQTSMDRTSKFKIAASTWKAGTSGNKLFEVCINEIFNGQWGSIAGLDTPDSLEQPMSQEVRRRRQKTFIYGTVGEEKYIYHIGGAPSDWALDRPGRTRAV